ncbi:MAG: 50S ribosomal protein L24 [Chloroflexi bacterium]|nr:50S ribosomal protein L24 [Chloroflexota bacterium]
MNKIRKGDTVQVISGNDRGKRGEVHNIDPKKGRVIVAGIHLVKKHQKRTGDVRTQAGIIEREGSINLSNVVVVCKSCGKATRVGFAEEGGKKLRKCKKCGQYID